MIILALAVFGLILGSFVNALVWRVFMQEKGHTNAKKDAVLPPEHDLSILKGRSMCPSCKHTLAAKDLVPLFSWLSLGGKCRYCRKSIGWQYPLVELLTAGLFVVFYMFWPYQNVGTLGLNDIINLGFWFLVFIPGFMALIVYDIRWMLLPNRIVFPLTGLAAVLATINIVSTDNMLRAIVQTLSSVAIAGGIFYLLFIISNGRWIGGGDVKLGFLIGLLLANPLFSFLMLLLASMLGTALVLPGLVLNKVSAKSRIPFGPFLIVAAVLVKLFGEGLINWYESYLLGPM
ncbi:MAG: prepilin peptidase [bacterium]|nr:prepilin peptidase [bacterium]